MSDMGSISDDEMAGHMELWLILILLQIRTDIISQPLPLQSIIMFASCFSLNHISLHLRPSSLHLCCMYRFHVISSIITNSHIFRRYPRTSQSSSSLTCLAPFRNHLSTPCTYWTDLVVRLNIWNESTDYTMIMIFDIWSSDMPLMRDAWWRFQSHLPRRRELSRWFSSWHIVYSRIIYTQMEEEKVLEAYMSSPQYEHSCNSEPKRHKLLLHILLSWKCRTKMYRKP